MFFFRMYLMLAVNFFCVHEIIVHCNTQNKYSIHKWEFFDDTILRTLWPYEFLGVSFDHDYASNRTMVTLWSK